MAGGTVSGVVSPNGQQSIGEDSESATTETVRTVGFQFVPEVLTVPTGTTVRWEGNSFDHTVTAAATMDDALNGTASGSFNEDLAAQETVQHTFEEPGDVPYFCRPHRQLGMVGRIVVE